MTIGASWLIGMLAMLGAAPADAQVMPGLRAPTDLVDGAVMATTSACWLASARRPVAGINRPAKDLAGEGLAEHVSAPDWVQKASAAEGRSRFATLATPEGKLWIRFDEETARCSVIVRPPDVETFRTAFGESLANGGTTRFKRETAADGSESFVNDEPTFAWTSRVSIPPDVPEAVLIETSFRPK